MKPYFQNGAVTIYHGDCREFPPIAADLLVTDPPYGVKERTKRKSAGRGKSTSTGFRFIESRDWPEVHGDDKPFDPAPWLTYPKVVLFGGNHFASRLPDASCWLVWDKREGTTSDDNADCEMAWTNLRGPARLYSQLWRGICRRGVENISGGAGRCHPTQKPLELMSWVVGRCKTNHGETLLDPYMGSGTTLLAARRFGLTAIGIEIEEAYCETAAKRLSQDTFGFNGAEPESLAVTASEHTKN